MYTVDRKLGLSQCTNVINEARGSGSMGRLADCFSKLLVLIRHNISVNYKQKQPSEFIFRRV